MKTVLLAAMAALLTFGAVSIALACDGAKAGKSTADTTVTPAPVKKGS